MRQIPLHSEWDALTWRLISSRHLLEREHFFMGFHREARYPVLLYRKILSEHGWILGPTGSGKTSRGLMPLVTQMILRGDTPVIVIDLKGDMALFQTVRIAAESGGSTFKYFTNELGYSTFVFNPYQQTNSEFVSLGQFVETIMESLRLNHGEGYGARFFSSQSREWLLNVIRKFPRMTSFEELYEKTSVDFFHDATERDRCKEAISVIQQLAQVEALNWRRRPGERSQVADSAIFMPDVLAQNQVLYFWLPSVGESMTVREIANLVLYAVLTACKLYKRANGREKRAYLVVDEWQRMASAGFALVLQQARSYGLGAILANQTMSDLETRDGRQLLDIALNNMGFRQLFCPCDPILEKLLLEQAGNTPHRGPILAYEDDTTVSAGSGARRTLNDLKNYSSDASTSILQIPRDSGFTCYGGHWFAIESPFHISAAEYERRSLAPWPEQNEHTIVALRERRGDDAGPAEVPATGARPMPREPRSGWGERLNFAFNRRFDKETGRKGGRF